MGPNELRNLTLACPVLDCEPNEKMKAKNVCYQHDGRVPIQNLSGALCFDVETEPITALPYYCPFNLAKQEFAWIEEYLQV